MFLKAIGVGIFIFIAGMAGYIILWHVIIDWEVVPADVSTLQQTSDGEMQSTVGMSDRAEVLAWKNVRIGSKSISYLPKNWSRIGDLTFYHNIFYVVLASVCLLGIYVTIKLDKPKETSNQRTGYVYYY
jgi:hypothetical protein